MPKVRIAKELVENMNSKRNWLFAVGLLFTVALMGLAYQSARLVNSLSDQDY